MDRLARQFKSKQEEDALLDFIFESDALRQLYRARCKDLGEPLSEDGARIFLSEYRSRNGDDSVNRSGAEIEAMNLSNMKLGLNSLYALTQQAKKHKSIRRLNLGNNMIKDFGAYSLRELLKVASVEELDLSSNLVTGAGVEKIADLLVASQTLRVLNLGVTRESFARNSLGFEGAKSIAELIRKSQSLRVLLLEDNNFDEECLEVIRAALPEGRLERLRLRGVGMKSAVAGRFVGSCQGLVSLDLSGNRIKDDFGRVFRACPSALESVDVSGNRLSHLFVEEMLVAFRSGVRLKGLKLSRNDLSGVSVTALTSLVCAPGLETLELAACRLPAFLLSTSLNNLSSSCLRTLDLSGNDFLNAGDLSRPSHSRGIPLRVLRLNGCRVDNKTFVSVFEFAKSLPKLARIELSDNLLTDEVADFIVQSLNGFSELRVLKLAQNRLNLHRLQSIAQTLRRTGVEAKHRRPRQLQYQLNKLLHEEAQIRTIQRAVGEVEEAILKCRERQKAAEIEEGNRQQNSRLAVDQTTEKIARQRTVLSDNQKLLAEKKAELLSYREEIGRERLRNEGAVKAKQAEVEAVAAEKSRLLESRRAAEEAFEGEHMRRMAVIQSLKDELNSLKTSSDLYAAQISGVLRLAEPVVSYR